MSSTRTAKPGAPFRQERFASSPEFERGLKANLVAKRAELLESDEDRELVWWLQWRSHAPEGLRGVAAELMERHPEAHVLPVIREHGFGPDAVWSPEQTFLVFRRLREEDSHYFASWNFIRGQASFLEDLSTGKISAEDYTPASALLRAKARLKKDLPQCLEEACLNPASWFNTYHPPGFPELRAALLALMREEAETSRQARVVTVVGRKVDEAFRFAWKTRGLVIVNGNPRIGKSHAARAWCEEHPGFTRYAQVPSASDEMSFLRAISLSLGISLPLKAKTTDLRIRIEEVLQSRQLLLCLDEGHHLFPHSNYRDALPQRINWLMTALVNHGVPVVLIVTPQFFAHQKRIEEKTSWTGGQFTGRVKRYFELPNELPKEDLAAVARHLLPDAGEKAIEVLAHVAAVSNKHLAAIDSVVDTARFIAEEAGRTEVQTADIVQAISEVMPSEMALAKAVKGPEAAAGKRRGRGPAALPPQPGHVAAAPLPPVHLASRRTESEPFSLPANHRQDGALIGG